MTTTANNISNDGFSRRRVGELYSFYAPTLRKQMLIYLAVSLVTAALILIPYNQYVKLSLMSMMGAALGYMYFFAACMFNRYGDTRIVERLIPASPGEKLTFFVSYLLVVVPIITYLPYEAACFIFPCIYSETGSEPLIYDLCSIQRSVPWIMILSNVLTNALCVLTCLYVITRAKRNRVVKAILITIAVSLVIGLVIGATTFALGVDSAMREVNVQTPASLTSEFQAGVNQGLTQSGEAINFMLENRVIFLSIDAVVACGIAWLLFATYRQLGRKNL